MVWHITLWKKKRENTVTCKKKNKKFIGLKIYNYKIAATATKSYFYCVQKVPHKINDWEFVRAKKVKKLVSKELRFYDWKVSFRFN